MITKRDAQVEIQSNVDELNKILRRMSGLMPDLAKTIIKKIAFGVYGDIVRRTPIDKGNARRYWNIKPINNGYAYRIGWANPDGVQYILYIEYGIAYQGHPLSDDKEKRKKQLRYLFATGILQENDGILVYTYTPVSYRAEGFIRNTLQEWTLKAPQMIKQWITDWLLKNFKDL